MHAPTLLLTTILTLTTTINASPIPMPMPLPISATSKAFSPSSANPKIVSLRDSEPQPEPALTLQIPGGGVVKEADKEESWLTDMAMERCGEKECDWTPLS